MNDHSATTSTTTGGSREKCANLNTHNYNCIKKKKSYRKRKGRSKEVVNNLLVRRRLRLREQRLGYGEKKIRIATTYLHSQEEEQELPTLYLYI